ncbi:fungal-specific transcription factor domain-containing protein [Talaromyces proteolyticus]|uniref:Fungal-specific transcription factor domain-containing protein n=1 Tax=Talaromyces proteolyticus TaxID=1131652 RepID=A0AAD4Q6N8_9EURO|nr:fungal-specific transcription factor domain-containing protein [Talaromyces proteolyticus]KAH8705838.1 fungal-specific transcription factor domain-containing protein [Talaromyces proteolyticus]
MQKSAMMSTYDHHGKKISRRSRVACKTCNRRKVRCDVTQTGPPCSNCEHEAAVCEVLPRKKHKPRVSRVVKEVTSDRRATDEIADQVPDTEGILPDDSACSYIGDTRGPRQSVYELCHPSVPQEESLEIVTRNTINASTNTLKPHEVDYIRHEGGYKVLLPEVCDELIRCYFHHVHSSMPVIDAPGFLNEYVENGSGNINPLLWWSMLLAATNFASLDILQRAGFSSRKAMKKAMYTRAKCFYDLDRGTDKLILIQSVLLMSFWYTDSHDHTGAWYWVGIAITLAQGIGIHRSPHVQYRHREKSQDVLSELRQRLIRRIWWTCVVRDRWLSLAKGRPMRIHDEDCDLSIPIDNDVLHELQNLSSGAHGIFIPTDIIQLAGMWVQLVKISIAMGRVLRMHYRLNSPKPKAEDIDQLAIELFEFEPSESSSLYDLTDILLLHKYHLELFYQASVTVLYRPYILNAPASFPTDSSATWQTTAQRRARTAASRTNSILEKIIDLDAVTFIKPMIITSLIPAMQIHLFDCKLGNRLQANLGHNKLQLCMLILDSLRETYWSAGVMFRLFGRAQNILNSRRDSSSIRTKLPSNSDSSFANRNEFTPNTSMSVFPVLNQGHSDSVVIGEELLSNSNGDVSPYFSSIDQLLSPGFSLSESHADAYFIGYPNTEIIGPAPMNLFYDMS